MAAKVNTRFVILVSTVLVGLVGSAAAAYFLVLKESPDELIAQGDAYLAQAEQQALQVDELEGEQAEEAFERSGESYMLAMEMFGKAFEARRTDVDLLVKYVDVLGKVHVDSDMNAQGVLQEQEQKLLLATQISNRDDLLERYYRQTLDQLLWGGGAASVNGILTRLGRHVSDKRLTDPENPVAIKYDGIVETLQLDRSSDLQRYVEAKESLDKAAELLPDDEMIPMYLAKWHIAEGRRIAQEGEGVSRPIGPEVREHVDLALQYSSAAMERFGADDLETRFRHLETLLAYPVFRAREPGNEENTRQIVEEVRSIVDGMRDQLMEDPSDMDAVLRVGDIMTRLDREVIKFEDRRGQTTTGIEKTEELLRAATKAQPFNVIYHVSLANLLKLQMDLDEALLAYQAADDISAVGPAEMLLRELFFKRQARYEIANITLIQAEKEQDPKVREEKLKVADEAIEHLDQVLPGKGAVHLLRGKVAMLRGDDTVAMQELDRAADLFSDGTTGEINIEAMLLSARARQKERQWGAAAERLEPVLRLSGIANSPESESRLRAQLAEIYINSDRRVEARREIDRLQEIGMDPRVTSMLDAGLLLREGVVDEAVAIYNDLGAMGDPATVRNIARALRREGRGEQAGELVRNYLDANPAELSLISELMATATGTVEERRDQMRAFLDRAEQAGASASSIAAIRASITPLGDGEGEGDAGEMVEAFAAAAGDEVTAELRRSQVWARMGDADKARAAYRRAEQLDPDSAQVIMAGIRFAHEDNDNRKLDALAERAARNNIDLADGDFVRGQIAALRNDIVRAISLYNQALAKRPVYDKGWQALGDLHVRMEVWDDAAEAYQKAVNQKPDNIGALMALAQVNLRRQRPVAALENLRRALRHSPENASVLQRYLAVELEHGDRNEALRVQSEVAARNPENQSAQINVALILSQAGRFQESQAKLAEIEERFGPSLQTTQARASIAVQSGDPEAGKQIYRDYLASRGDDLTTGELLAHARFLSSVDESEASMATYRSAMEMDENPEMPVARELADRMFENNRFQEATDLYGMLIDQAETSESDRLRLVRRQVETRLRLNDVDTAESLLQGLPDDEQTLVLRSIVARQKGDMARAKSLLDQAIQGNPDYALAYLQRGLIQAADDPQAALDDANRALQLQRDFAPAQQLRARVLMGMGRAEDAIRGFNTVLNRTPEDSISRIALAELLLRESELQTAQLVVAEGERFDPTNPAWNELQARIAFASGDPEQVIVRLEEALANSPSPRGVQALAEQYMAADRAEDALQMLNEQSRFVNQSVLLQSRKGQALMLTGNPEGGARLLLLSMQRSPSRAELGYTTRSAVEAMGVERGFDLLELAMRDVERSLDVAMAKSMVLIGQQDFTQALGVLQEAEALADGRDAGLLTTVRKMIALSNYNTGDFEQAEAAYRRVLEANPDDVESLNNLAFLLTKELGRPADALPLAEKAVALTQPPQASVMDTLGVALFKSGQLDRARETLENALLYDAQLPAVHLHLAQVYQAQGLDARASDSAREALRLAQSSRDADTEAQARRLLDEL